MRLIDADWVLGHLKPYEPSDEEWGVTGGTALRLIHNAVDNAPTVDAVPVVHGRWVTHYLSGTTVAEGYVSTCCDMWNNRKSDYCPPLRAKMDGGNENV
ncbi:hypothetical protein [Dysosmobacter sp.]|uniref:hypothetical protein n=1 Tax=Dysosmobacter sp. TaxID=2591382 RepID=UPI003A8E9500